MSHVALSIQGTGNGTLPFTCFWRSVWCYLVGSNLLQIQNLSVKTMLVYLVNFLQTNCARLCTVIAMHTNVRASITSAAVIIAIYRKKSCLKKGVRAKSLRLQLKSPELLTFQTLKFVIR